MEPVNKFIVLCCLLAVSTAGFLGYHLKERTASGDKLAVDAQAIRAQLTQLQADASAKATAAAALETKVKELSAAVAQSQTELSSARQRIKEIDELNESEKNAKLAKEQELRRAMAQIPPPTVVITTNSTRGEVRSLVFDKLPGRNGQTLAQNAEFLSVDGRKVFFKYGTGGGGGIDVDTLHLGVLAHLGIDPDAAKQLQTKLDVQRNYEESLRQQAAAARIAFYEKLKNERREADAKVAAQRATELAAEAEADRQRKQSENERMQAEAAKKQADAAMLQATRPPDYLLNQTYSGPPTTPGAPTRPTSVR